MHITTPKKNQIPTDSSQLQVRSSPSCIMHDLAKAQTSTHTGLAQRTSTAGSIDANDKQGQPLPLTRALLLRSTYMYMEKISS